MNSKQFGLLLAVCAVMSLVGSMTVANMLLGDTRLELKRTDLNGNSVIDIADVSVIAKAFGQSVPAEGSTELVLVNTLDVSPRSSLDTRLHTFADGNNWVYVLQYTDRAENPTIAVVPR